MPSAKNSMATEEKRWRAESDARTLTEYNMIIKDKERLRMAKAQAKKMLKEEKQRVAGLEAIIKTKE